MRARTTAAALVLAGLAGCASCDQVPASAVTDCNAQIVPGSAATDLLFVVDDSGSMSPYQTRLAENLAAFIDQLLSSAIALDVRVGVTSTSVSEGSANGAADGTTTYLSGPSSGDPYPQGSLVAVLDPDGIVTPGLLAYDPVLYGTTTGGWGGHRMLGTSGTPPADVARFFKANVRLGRSGSGKEQPLKAMRLAIDKAHRLGGDNLGFLRDGARLVVVILTDEDDCSQSAAPYITAVYENATTPYPGCHNPAVKTALPPQPPPYLDPLADFATLLDTTVGGAPIVAVVSGFDPRTLDPVGCTTNGVSTYDDPTRLDAFLQMLSATHPDRTYKDSLCSEFGPALTRLAGMIIPQTMPLQRAPADFRMIAVSVRKASGQLVGCGAVEPAPSPGANVVYTPAPPGGQASLTFQNACRIGLGDQVNLNIVCAH